MNRDEALYREGLEHAYAYWIDNLAQAFPIMAPFAQPAEFIAQLEKQIHMRENAALARAIRLLEFEGLYGEPIRLVRSCMKGSPDG